MIDKQHTSPWWYRLWAVILRWCFGIKVAFLYDWMRVEDCKYDETFIYEVSPGYWLRDHFEY